MNLKKATIATGITGNRQLTGTKGKKFTYKKDQVNLLHRLLSMYVLVTKGSKPSKTIHFKTQLKWYHSKQAWHKTDALALHGITMANLAKLLLSFKHINHPNKRISFFCNK